MYKKLVPSKNKVIGVSSVLAGFTAFGCYMHPAIYENPEHFFVGYRRYMREV